MAVLPLLSLCTGAGGLERGVELVLGDRALLPVLYVEREAFACTYLAAQMEASRLAQAPIWSDLQDVPDTILDIIRAMGEDHGLIVTAGFPCQPHSLAGRRKHTGDERWLWPDIARILRTVGPSIVFLENVPNLASGGLAQVLATLVQSGLNAEWDCFSAREAGAPHQRDRFFLLAADERGLELLADANRHGHSESGRVPREEHLSGSQSEILANADRERWRTRRTGRIQKSNVSQQDREDLANTNGRRRGESTYDVCTWESKSREDGDILANASRHGWREERSWSSRDQGRSNALGSGDIPLWPPAPDDLDAWREILNRWPLLAPAVDEAATQSALRALAHGESFCGSPRPPARADWIRLAGNGVVPEQAALAFRELARRLRKQY